MGKQTASKYKGLIQCSSSTNSQFDKVQTKVGPILPLYDLLAAQWVLLWYPRIIVNILRRTFYPFPSKLTDGTGSAVLIDLII